MQPVRAATPPCRLPMPPASDTPSGPLERARVHARLAGFADADACRLTASARREADPSADPVRFWRALYRAIASSSRHPVVGSDAIAAALVSLPIEARTSLLLRVAESLQTTEIAAALDEPEPRARRHLADAVAGTRRTLGRGRADADWVADLRRWLDSRPRFEPPPEPPPRRAPAAAPANGRATAGGAPGAWRLWLALALGLAAFGALRLWMERGPGGSAAAPPEPAPMPPVGTLLNLPEEDHALIADEVDLDALARLDFLLWDERSDGR